VDGVSRINPLVRGLLIVAAISAVIVALRLQTTLSALYLIARIAFLLAIAFFVYLLWRERRQEISFWSARARTVFYAAAILIVADLAAISFVNETGPDAVAFVAVLALSAFAMWRTWRDQNTYV
jgi:fucose 4-O-acetylase-like acetyltransferase